MDVNSAANQFTIKLNRGGINAIYQVQLLDSFAIQLHLDYIIERV